MSNDVPGQGPVKRMVRPGAEAARLVEYLKGYPRTDGVSAAIRVILEQAAEIERLRAAIRIVREYPEFDDGGPLPEMLDQVLRGEPAPMLDALDRLALGPNGPHQR